MKNRSVLLFLVIFAKISSLVAECNTKFAFCVCSYNNEPFVEWNLDSIFNQDYDEEKFHVYYINDMSTDHTLEKAINHARSRHKEHMITFIDNKEKRYPTGNHYHCIHEYIEDPNTVVVTVDGDDALAHSEVLQYLDNVYSQTSPKIYLTYGQFIEKNSGQIGFCKPMPKLACNRQSFRRVQDGPSHLRTFYAWLFKAIRLEDLCYNGKFATMTGDLAMMFPMIEMANGHFKYIPDVLYIYNDNNPISEHRVGFEFQTNLSSYFRNLTPYMPIDPKIAKKISCSFKKNLIKTELHKSPEIFL